MLPKTLSPCNVVDKKFKCPFPGKKVTEKNEKAQYRIPYVQKLNCPMAFTLIWTITGKNIQATAWEKIQEAPFI